MNLELPYMEEDFPHALHFVRNIDRIFNQETISWPIYGQKQSNLSKFSSRQNASERDEDETGIIRFNSL